ncbi:MAG: hypothetical protein QXZ31_05535 [Thermofilaceae archaeon]
MAGAAVYESTVEELEQLLTDVAERFREGDLEGAAQRVSVLFSPPYVEIWKLRARRSFAKLRKKLEVRYGKRISQQYLFMRGLQILYYSIAYSILQRLGFSSFYGSRMAWVASGTAYMLYNDLSKGWKRTAYAKAVTCATYLEEGYDVPHALAFKLVALATAITFYLIRNPSPVEELYYKVEEIRQQALE